MKIFWGLVILSTILITSCSKDDPGGSGLTVTGKNTLVVSVMHHNYHVSGVTVYLKENTTEFPGSDTTLYDWKTVSDGSGTAVFEKLFEGNYFLYAKGMDPFIGQEVIGGTPVVLNSSTITNNEVYVTLNVTE